MYLRRGILGHCTAQSLYLVHSLLHRVRYLQPGEHLPHMYSGELHTEFGSGVLLQGGILGNCTT